MLKPAILYSTTLSLFRRCGNCQIPEWGDLHGAEEPEAGPEPGRLGGQDRGRRGDHDPGRAWRREGHRLPERQPHRRLCWAWRWSGWGERKRSGANSHQWSIIWIFWPKFCISPPAFISHRPDLTYHNAFSSQFGNHFWEYLHLHNVYRTVSDIINWWFFLGLHIFFYYQFSQSSFSLYFILKLYSTCSKML